MSLIWNINVKLIFFLTNHTKLIFFSHKSCRTNFLFPQITLMDWYHSISICNSFTSFKNQIFIFSINSRFEFQIHHCRWLKKRLRFQIINLKLSSNLNSMYHAKLIGQPWLLLTLLKRFFCQLVSFYSPFQFLLLNFKLILEKLFNFLFK